MPLTRFADVLQLQDLKRHEDSEQHIKNLVVEQPLESVPAEADATVPTPGQVHLAIQVLMEPRSGQSVGYASRCELANRADPGNFPLARSSPCDHAKIITATAAVLREEAGPEARSTHSCVIKLLQDRRLAKNCKAAGWAEDCGHSQWSN